MKLLFAMVCATACGTVLNAKAAACDSNFSSSGNFLIGTTYKTVDELPAVNSNVAFDGALADISAEPSWKVLSTNKATGDIQAVNADSYAKGKSIPFNVHIDAVGSGSKISLSYVTSPGVLSPEAAIRAQFCKTIAAAASFVSNQPSKGQTAAATATSANNAGNGRPPLGEAAANMPRTNEYWKNGLPCIAELCVGDGISALKKVQWDRATHSVTPEPSPKYRSDGPLTKGGMPDQLKINNGLYRGDLEKTVLYLNRKVFDNHFLNQAQKLVVCRGFTNTLTGRFTSKSGNPTQVEISLQPISGVADKQEWIVFSISRRFPQVSSSKQMTETLTEMQRRYGASKYHLDTEVWDASREIRDDGIGFRLKVSLEVEELIRLHPTCGGAAKVNVD